MKMHIKCKLIETAEKKPEKGKISSNRMEKKTGKAVYSGWKKN